jgi:hypothetical protein
LATVHGASDEFDHRVKRQFQAMIEGAATGLDFNSVVGIFGADWKENREAENEIFMAITREPFNPPPPKPTGFMGDAIITIRGVTPPTNKTSHFDSMETECCEKSIALLRTKVARTFP